MGAGLLAVFGHRNAVPLSGGRPPRGQDRTTEGRERVIRRNEFVDHVIDTMRSFGPVEARAMFGGWGLYHQGLFFALVLEDTLYLKSDARNVAAFEAEGLEPCVYEAGGKKIVMHYRRAPDEALESPAVMAEWARLGYAAAVRANAS